MKKRGRARRRLFGNWLGGPGRAALRPAHRAEDYLNSSISKSVFLLVAKIQGAGQGHAFVSNFFEQFGGIGI